MTQLLVRRKPPVLALRSDWHFAVEQAGGEHLVPDGAGRQAIIDECVAKGVKALTIPGAEMSLVASLPQLEFLSVHGMPDDVAAVAELPRLRGLRLHSGWLGRLEPEWVANLEWLNAGDGRYSAGLEAVLENHGLLRHVVIGLYQESDLRILGRLPHMRRIVLIEARRLRSLNGLAAVAGSLRGLSLQRCALLGSIEAIGTAAKLEYLMLSYCPKIKKLDGVDRLPALRMLDVERSAPLDTLAPLAGHPALEVLYLNTVADRDLDPVALMPSLKVFRAQGADYNRDKNQLMRAGVVPASDPIFADLPRLVQG
jgi:hypothetical protein